MSPLSSSSSRCLAMLLLCAGCAVSGCAFAPASREPAAPGATKDGRSSSPDESSNSSPSDARTRTPKPSAAVKPDTSSAGGKQIGKASFYADKFAGRKMADGSPMDPSDNNAAHKTLPLGSTARVTNLETGRSAVITIQDRGPFVKGRIVDLSPATAREIGLSREDGLAQVEVTPLSSPPSDGTKEGRPAAR